MTDAQRRAMSELWPRFGVEPGDGVLDFPGLFGRAAPVVLEIGFGNGETLAALAVTTPQVNYFGIEVHRPGVGGLLRRLAAADITNVRVMVADAKEILARLVPDASLTAVHLFFPDPWPKKRHHKRRLVQSDFVELVSRKLLPGGIFHLTTDWQDYAHHMMAVLSASGALENVAGAGHFGERGERPPTKFERRGARLGHGVWDLVFRRRPSAA
jgi:tRNA (guanine-N7-)-methyltransferase